MTMVCLAVARSPNAIALGSNKTINHQRRQYVTVIDVQTDFIVWRDSSSTTHAGPDGLSTLSKQSRTAT